MVNTRTADLATHVLHTARTRGMKIATAESCTGGLVGAALTAIAGSSDVFDCGFTSYSYDAKVKQLGVDRATLEQSGAVSADIAAQMARGALAASVADIAVSATGIAGPGGATPDKPVGLVYLAVAVRASGRVVSDKNIFTGDRDAVRAATVVRALELLQREMEAA